MGAAPFRGTFSPSKDGEKGVKGGRHRSFPSPRASGERLEPPEEEGRTESPP
jgi:hypothetical protein